MMRLLKQLLRRKWQINLSSHYAGSYNHLPLTLHIIGDIFDRGPRADINMNELLHMHDVDI